MFVPLAGSTRHVKFLPRGTRQRYMKCDKRLIMNIPRDCFIHGFNVRRKFLFAFLGSVLGYVDDFTRLAATIRI